MTQQQWVNQWYLLRDGQQTGPITDREMEAFVAAGHLKMTDMVWRDGFAEWQHSGAIFQPAQPAQPPPQAAASLTPIQIKNESISAPKESTVKTVFGDYIISHNIGTVQSVQIMTHISGHSSGGGGMVQGGTGYVAAPSVKVTSAVTQRVFLIDGSGAEKTIHVGEDFAVRPGNRVQTSFAGLRGKECWSGVAKNIDTKAVYKWPTDQYFPGFWRLWLALAVVWLVVVFSLNNAAAINEYIWRDASEQSISKVIDENCRASGAVGLNLQRCQLDKTNLNSVFKSTLERYLFRLAFGATAVFIVLYIRRAMQNDSVQKSFGHQCCGDGQSPRNSRCLLKSISFYAHQLASRYGMRLHSQSDRP